MKKITKKGFTLIELLVVVAIIGVLASLMISSLSKAKIKGNDAGKISTLKQLEIALELYYLDHGEYPRATSAWGVNNSTHTNTGINPIGPIEQTFIDNLDPYMKRIELNDIFLGKGFYWGDFYYRSSAANNYQSYGAWVRTDLSNSAAKNDGGYWPSTTDTTKHGHEGGSFNVAFEIGEDSKYCMEKHFSSFLGSAATRCNAGN